MRPENFARITSLGVDIHGLMSHFFNVVRLAAGIEAAAYFINCRNQTQARFYKNARLDRSKFERFKDRFIARIPACRPGVQPETLDFAGASVLPDGHAHGAPEMGALHYCELPLFYKGEQAGLIIISYVRNDPFDADLTTELTLFINRVLEGFFEQAFEEEKILADIMSSLDQGVFIADSDGFLTVMNSRGAEFLPGFCRREMDCATRSGGGRLRTPGCECAFSNLLGKFRDSEEANRVYSEETMDNRGQTFLFTVSGLARRQSRKHRYVITAKDITEQKLMQDRMLLSSKLASLGEMVAGIAHEINNPLQAVLLNIELYEATMAEYDDGAERLKPIKEGVLRIKKIVKDLLVFAREKGIEMECADVNALIGQAVELLAHQLKMASVSVRLRLDDGPLVVRCNRNLFQQVMINLLQNSKDAIEGSRKGSTIEIASFLRDGEVVVETSDDGPGISKEIIDRVFDPFFTTKDAGKGTGLGLSVSRKILENMGGGITASAAPAGASFSITLPHDGPIIEEGEKGASGEREYDMLLGRSVLIVDDEKEVAGLISEAVSASISRIETAGDGREALEKIMRRDFDFIFLDIMIPGMDGLELFGRITERNPRLAEKIVFISANSWADRIAEFVRHTKCRLLPKPFSVNELLDVMCEMTRDAPVAGG